MKREAIKKTENQNLARKFLAFSFIYSMLFNRLTEEELADYHKIINFYDNGCAINVEVNLEQKESFYVDYEHLCLYYEKICASIPEGFYLLCGPLISHRIILFLSADCSPEDADQELREQCKEIALNIRQMLIEQAGFSIRVGIGAWRTISELGISYEESVRCVRYREDFTVSMIEDCGNYMPSIYQYDELKKKFLSSIKFGEEISLVYYAQIMELISALNLDAQKNLIMELLVLAISEIYSDEATGEENYFDFIEYGVELAGLDKEKLASWAYSKFQTVIRVTRQRRIDKKGYLIKNALSYLEEHYQEDVSLGDVAERAGMTPQYFSTVFKQATGRNFVEWLSEHRIRKAMEYLEQPGAVVKEVCFKVGYNDPNYFSRIFKKICGMTPKEFMSQKETEGAE